MSCDLAAVDALAKALHADAPGSAGSLADADRPVVVAAAGWAPLCAGDGVLDSQLAQIATAKPENWWLVELQTGVLDAHLWERACSGGSRAMAMATKLDPSLRRGHLWEACGLASLGAFDAEEWKAATGLVSMPILAAHTLTAGGVPPERARPILRALAGLE